MFTGIPHINNMDEDQLTCHRLKHLWAGTIAITILWIQFASLSMLCPTPATAATQKAHWNNKEVQVLLEFLKSQASTSEGTGVMISSQTCMISFLQILLEQHAMSACSFIFTFFHA